MSLSSVINDIVDEKLLDTSTAFIGKIISFDQTKKTANVQPLTMTKAYGKEAKQRSVLTDIPVAHNAQYRIDFVPVYLGASSTKYWFANPDIYIQSGDLCVCIVCDRDISEARKGNSALPPLGCHEIQNSIVIAIL